jgi:hypothetical protein
VSTEDGTPAVLDVDEYGHGDDTTVLPNRALVINDTEDVVTLTFVETGGTWFMTRGDTLSHKTLPYTAS